MELASNAKQVEKLAAEGRIKEATQLFEAYKRQNLLDIENTVLLPGKIADYERKVADQRKSAEVVKTIETLLGRYDLQTAERIFNKAREDNLLPQDKKDEFSQKLHDYSEKGMLENIKSRKDRDKVLSLAEEFIARYPNSTARPELAEKLYVARLEQLEATLKEPTTIEGVIGMYKWVRTIVDTNRKVLRDEMLRPLNPLIQQGMDLASGKTEFYVNLHPANIKLGDKVMINEYSRESELSNEYIQERNARIKNGSKGQVVLREKDDVSGEIFFVVKFPEIVVKEKWENNGDPHDHEAEYFTEGNNNAATYQGRRMYTLIQLPETRRIRLGFELEKLKKAIGPVESERRVETAQGAASIN